MKKIVSLCAVMVLLLGVVVGPAATHVHAQEKCEHINLLMYFGEQTYVDGQYSEEVTTTCKDCGELLNEQKIKSDTEIDIDTLALEVDFGLISVAPMSYCPHSQLVQTYGPWYQKPCYTGRIVTTTCKGCTFRQELEQQTNINHTGTSGAWRDGGHVSTNQHYYYKLCTYDSVLINQIYVNCSGSGGHIAPYSLLIE